MARQTVMARVYPDDVPRLDAIRRWLQAQGNGNDRTIADAVAFLAGTFCQMHPTLDTRPTTTGEE